MRLTKIHLVSSSVAVVIALLFGVSLVPIEVKILIEKIGWIACPLLLIKDVSLIDFPISMPQGFSAQFFERRLRSEMGLSVEYSTSLYSSH